MLDKFIATVALALFGYLEKRMSAGRVAVDADVDRASLARAGARIREWMRKQDDLRAGGKPDASRAPEPDLRVSPDRRDVDAVPKQD